MDQRGLLRNMLARELGGSEPPAEMVSEFKTLVAQTLTKEASSILLDIEYGLEATKHINGKGLLLAYEHAGYSPDKPERLPSLFEGWSALRIKEAGANAVKILVYYNPFEKEWVNDRKKRLGRAHRSRVQGRRHSVFPRVPALRRARRRRETASNTRAASRRSSSNPWRSSRRERYGADVLKIEVPMQMAHVEGTRAFKGQKLHTRAEAMEFIRAEAALTDKPIIFLSAGVSSQVFLETLELAVESGAQFHGVLAGRATWQDGVPVYVKGGASALEAWLNSTGLNNVREINKILKSAYPWHEARSVQG